MNKRLIFSISFYILIKKIWQLKVGFGFALYRSSGFSDDFLLDSEVLRTQQKVPEHPPACFSCCFVRVCVQIKRNFSKFHSRLSAGFLAQLQHPPAPTLFCSLLVEISAGCLHFLPSPRRKGPHISPLLKFLTSPLGFLMQRALTSSLRDKISAIWPELPPHLSTSLLHSSL